MTPCNISLSLTWWFFFSAESNSQKPTSRHPRTTPPLGAWTYGAAHTTPASPEPSIRRVATFQTAGNLQVGTFHANLEVQYLETMPPPATQPQAQKDSQNEREAHQKKVDRGMTTLLPNNKPQSAVSRADTARHKPAHPPRTLGIPPRNPQERQMSMHGPKRTADTEIGRQAADSKEQPKAHIK